MATGRGAASRERSPHAGPALPSRPRCRQRHYEAAAAGRQDKGRGCAQMEPNDRGGHRPHIRCPEKILSFSKQDTPASPSPLTRPLTVSYAGLGA